MTQFSRKPVENAAPRRGRPPTRDPLEVAGEPSAEPSALDRLEARARAPQDAAAEVGEALRARLAVYADRARACATRLRQFEAAAAPVLAKVRALPLEEYAMVLGEGRAIVPHLRAVIGRLSILFQPRAEFDLTVPSTLMTLDRIPARIRQLTGADVHACAAVPPGCGCKVATLKLDVENSERSAAAGPRDLATLHELLDRLDSGLRARGDVVVTTLSRPRASASVEVVNSTGDQEGDLSDE